MKAVSRNKLGREFHGCVEQSNASHNSKRTLPKTHLAIASPALRSICTAHQQDTQRETQKVCDTGTVTRGTGARNAKRNKTTGKEKPSEI